jgi:hypothetical protein
MNRSCQPRPHGTSTVPSILEPEVPAEGKRLGLPFASHTCVCTTTVTVVVIASFVVALAALIVSGIGVQYSRMQSHAAIRQADAAKIQADAATAQVLIYAEMTERQQASEVKLAVRPISGAGAGALPPESTQLVHMAIVTNDSPRPIRNVVCRITLQRFTSRLAAVVGQLTEYKIASNVTDEALVNKENTDRSSVIPPGARFGFVFPFDLGQYPKVLMAVRFTDDSGVDWEIDHELRLSKLVKRDGW